MIIKTVQPLSVLSDIKTYGVAYAMHSTEKEEYWSFFESYEWMKLQMIKKGLNPTYPTQALFWGDATDNICVARPDTIILTLEKDPSELLFSSYELWHWVLNYSPISLDLEEEKFWDTNTSGIQPCPVHHEDIQKSWENIFNINYLGGSFISNFTRSDYMEFAWAVQATFWDIKESEIFNVD